MHFKAKYSRQWFGDRSFRKTWHHFWKPALEKIKNSLRMCVQEVQEDATEEWGKRYDVERWIQHDLPWRPIWNSGVGGYFEYVKILATLAILKRWRCSNGRWRSVMGMLDVPQKWQRWKAREMSWQLAPAILVGRSELEMQSRICAWSQPDVA